MRRTVTMIGLVGGVLACAGPRVDVAAERAAVQARSEALVAAESAQDIDAAMPFWTSDAVILPSGSPMIQGTAALRQLYESFFGTGMLKSFEGTTSYIEVSAGGDLAYEYGSNRMVLNTPDGDMLDAGKYLAIWKKVDGEWYVHVLSFNSDTPAPVPVATP